MTWLGSTVPLALLALAAEAAVGYPDRLFRVLGHPVTWMGALIATLDHRLNRAAWPAGLRRAAGVLALLALLLLTALPCLLLAWALPAGLPGLLVAALLAASLPAQRSLHAHVRAVAEALEREGLPGGRRAVSMIVGRNPETLDEAGVARAAIESLAENFSDGVVGPTLWTALGGLAGGALYKAANTADSMIGHRDARYEAFGWAAARFDDLVNLPASRLATLWLLAGSLLGGADAAAAWWAVRRDARHHRSPNAGWPEAAMAGALGLTLGGPRAYGAVAVDGAYLGAGRREAGPADIRRALRLYRRACAIQGAALLAVALALALR